jgi:eukaryotic-like serine/threonine-protein kinase
VTPEHEFAARRVGRVVAGKWTLDRLLGIGGMAAVYAARDNRGTLAAVKILHPEVSLREDVRERFLREGTAANRVGHPGAVRVLEDGSSEDGSAYLVMELLVGESLSDRVRRHGTLPVGELLDYLDQILDVLIAAHERGIIHRDLKPDNMFVGNDGRIKILDFGLARLDSGPGGFQTKTGLALGTLPYMAPEQALGRRAEIDGRADLFAIGATAFRILAGRKVHEGDSEAELLIAMASRPAPALASVAPQLQPEVCAIIDLCLAFSRDARYPDARTMQLDVRAIREGKPPPYAMRQATARDEPTRADRTAAVLPGSSSISAPLSVSAHQHAPPSQSLPAFASQHSHAPAMSQASPATHPGAAPHSQAVPLPPKRSKNLVLLLGLIVLALVALAAGAAVLALFVMSRDSGADALVPELAPDGAVAAGADSAAAPPIAAADPAAAASSDPAPSSAEAPAQVMPDTATRSRPKSSASASAGNSKPAVGAAAASAAVASPAPATPGTSPPPPPAPPPTTAAPSKPEPPPPSETSKGSKGKGRDKHKDD